MIDEGDEIIEDTFHVLFLVCVILDVAIHIKIVVAVFINCRCSEFHSLQIREETHIEKDFISFVEINDRISNRVFKAIVRLNDDGIATRLGGIDGGICLYGILRLVCSENEKEPHDKGNNEWNDKCRDKHTIIQHLQLLP